MQDRQKWGGFDALMAYERQTQALRQVAGRVGWGQDTMMARRGAHQRAP